MIKMILCNDIVCQECFVSHYSLMIKEKSIKHLDCLVCGEPDMSSGVTDAHDYLQKFSALIQAHLSENQYNMFMLYTLSSLEFYFFKPFHVHESCPWKCE